MTIEQDFKQTSDGSYLPNGLPSNFRTILARLHLSEKFAIKAYHQNGKVVEVELLKPDEKPLGGPDGIMAELIHMMEARSAETRTRSKSLFVSYGHDPVIDY